jgi:hypothetical protein
VSRLFEIQILEWSERAGSSAVHRKNASSRMMMRANPKFEHRFDHKTAMIIARA